MRTQTRRRLTLATTTTAALTAFAATGWGQVDNVVTLINATNATAGKSIAAFGYDPTTDTGYVSSFGFSGSGGNATLRKITNVSDAPNQVSTPMISEAQMQLYYRDGDPDISVTNPTPGSLVLNPLPLTVGSTTFPAYSVSHMQDAANSRFPGTTTTNPATTKRVYRWNLKAVGDPSLPPPTFGDGRDVLTTVATLQNFMDAVPTTSSSNNMNRQFAYSGDGQSLYLIDSGAALSGLFRVNLQNGSVTRLIELTEASTEPAVLSQSGVDSIFFRGGGTTGNVGGIDKITFDGTTPSARTVHVSAAALADFFELATGDTISNFSMTADSAGNLYFNDGTSSGPRKGIYKLDPQGRVIKVLGYEERRASFTGTSTGTPNANTLRMTPRTTNFAGSNGSFTVGQIMYVESSASNFSGANTVAGAYVFKPGDFDRDNDADQSDVALFKSALSLRGVVLSGILPADQPKLKFDLNGNNEVSWKDVKILQQFYAFPDGDADINKSVDLDDFTALAANFGLNGKLWTEGDFNGDEAVSLDDFTILAANFGVTSPTEHAARASVPEPTSFGALVVASAMAMRRRRC